MACCTTALRHGYMLSTLQDLAEGQPFGQAVQAAPQLCHHLPTFVLGECGHHGSNRRLVGQRYEAGWSRRKPDGEGLQPECLVCFVG